MIVISVFAILVIAVLVKYFLHMHHMEVYVKHLQFQSPAYPFFGSALSLIGKAPSKLFQEFVDSIKSHDSPIKAYIGPSLIVIADKPEDFKTVLMSQSCLGKPYLYQFYPSAVGLASATSPAVWKPIRKLMNPSFNMKILQSFLPIMNEKVNILVENLNQQVLRPHFDILPFMNECTFDMISATTMGYNVDVQRNRDRKFLQSIEAYFEIVGIRFIKFWMHSDFIFRWTMLYKEQQKHLNVFRSMTDRIYHIKMMEYVNKVKNPSSEENTSNNNSDNSYEPPQILIDQLLRLQFAGKLDEKTVKDELETILISGNETSALTVSYIILLLAMHPDVQERVFQELHSNYETQDEKTTYEHLQRMSYLDRVIKEGLRLFPVGPFLVRNVSADLPISNCTIPKNSYVTLSIFNLHRRTDVWGENADQFNPDNFLPENVSKRHPFSYLPFAAGQRNCIGYQYGMMSIKTMMSAVLRHFKFTTKLNMSELEMKFEITLKLCNKHLIGIERRRW